ncbi:MAG: hypothetical protein A2284_18545 [Deltaproteobacteria bacterium RIFOXYA12_FULL_61_11]|nr:MAG: hypothetical protein A2284_18545 [Deltaproteobacteria bacterium RIFOXYA12_FULL_61_11]
MTKNNATVVLADQPRDDTIGEYRVLGRPLGKGGMATVYKVEDAEGNVFAIKELFPELGRQKEFIRRFRREFELAAGLNHPGLVRHYRLFEDNLTWNLVLEYVEGLDCKALLRKLGPLAPDEAVALTCEVLDALAYLHRQKLVHRDIKPSNVLLTPEGRVKLSDFGVARPTAGGDLTRADAVIGTPVYMAPELFGGHAGPPSPSADIYACGVFLHELLTRRNPFGVGSKDDLVTTIAKITTTAPRRVASANEELNDILKKALAAEPAERFSNAGEMREALETLLPPSSIPRRLLALLYARVGKEKPTKKKTVPKEPLGLRPADLVGLGFLFAVVGLVLSAFFIKVP